MRVQQIIDYIERNYSEFVNNPTMDREEFFSILEDIYDLGADDSRSENYDDGYEEGYSKGYDDCLNDYDLNR